ncbi:hypothetical protein ACS0TY_002151 [Phlomoides rotata]
MPWAISVAVLSFAVAVSASFFSRHDSLTVVNNTSDSSPSMFLPLFFNNHDHLLRHKEDIFARRRLLNRSTPDARMPLYDDLLINGYYSTRLWIGTPPQRFTLIVDTGSTVTYVPCSTCELCGKHQDPRFQPELSSTYRPVKCNIDCICDNDSKQCIYERQYAEMSSSSGVLGKDTLSFGNQSDLKPQQAIFGCENRETGNLYSQHADGIMGLGRGDLSIVDQLVKKNAISDSFSLCYGGMDLGGGAMVLGGISPHADMVFTRSDPVRSPYYNIELSEIRVAGKKLPVNPRVFDGKHGTVLDSGTTYAYLPEAAFVAFKEAVSDSLCGLCYFVCLICSKSPTVTCRSSRKSHPSTEYKVLTLIMMISASQMLEVMLHISRKSFQQLKWYFPVDRSSCCPQKIFCSDMERCVVHTA